MQFSQVENAQPGSRKLQLIREEKIRIYIYHRDSLIY